MSVNIATVSFKGGVGKSTISDMLQNKLTRIPRSQFLMMTQIQTHVSLQFSILTYRKMPKKLIQVILLI